jgi:hypothetical protein
MPLPPELRLRAKIKGTKTSSISVFIAQSLYWPDRTTRPIPLDSSRRVGPNSYLPWSGARGSRIGFRTRVIFFKIGARVTYTVEPYTRYTTSWVFLVSSLTVTVSQIMVPLNSLHLNLIKLTYNLIHKEGMY